MSTNAKYFKWFLTTFKSSGFLSPKSPKFFILKYGILPILCVLLGFATYNFRFKSHDIFEFASCCLSISSHIHVLIRHWTLLKYSSVVENLLKNSLLYWKYDLFGKNFEGELNRKTSYYVWIFEGLRVSVYVVLTTVFLRPLLFKGIDLPQESWIPGSSEYCRILIYVLQMICFFEFSLLILVFDGTFLFTCSELENQFILLGKLLESIVLGEDCSVKHEGKCLLNLRKCVKYHLFLLEVHNDLKKISSLFFFLQYLVSIEGLCVQIFVIKKSDVFQDVFVAVFYLIGVTLQCCGTFLAASNVEIQAETLPEALYNIDWYNAKTSKFRKNMIFLMMKTQEPLRLSGAGMFDIDRNRLLQIMRIAFSISTLFQRMHF